MRLFWEIVKFLFYSILIVVISKYSLVKILRKIGALLKLKPKTIGNIAGIATSIPEFLTVSFSALTGLITTSTYNIISSNVINVVQYGVAIILNKNQKVLRNKAIQTDLILVMLTIVIPIFMMIFRRENKMGIVPIFLILLYIFYKTSNNAHKVYLSKQNRKELSSHDKEKTNEVEKKHNKNKEYKNVTIQRYNKREISAVVLQGVLLAIVGIILYFIGNLLSDVLDNLCTLFYIPEFILGILLGFITSLPELITFFESQRHHEEEKEGVVEATSNLLTSNIMNLFVIQSIGIILYHIVVSG